ncbi:unnamed protein product, partial [Discosporangium mesarthrocarpum]
VRNTSILEARYGREGKKMNIHTSIVETLARKLSPSGLDLVVPLKVAWYNELVPEALHLSPGSEAANALAILVGNTAALWEPFIACLRTRKWHPSCKSGETPSSFSSGGHCGHIRDKRDWGVHPLDSYVMDVVETAAREVGNEVLGAESSFEIRWVHDTAPGRLVAIQRMAEAAGLCYLDQGTHLSLHPIYGPWVAFRGVLLAGGVQGPVDSARPPCPPPPAPPEELSHAARVMADGIQQATRMGVPSGYEQMAMSSSPVRDNGVSRQVNKNHQKSPELNRNKQLLASQPPGTGEGPSPLGVNGGWRAGEGEAECGIRVDGDTATLAGYGGGLGGGDSPGAAALDKYWSCSDDVAGGGEEESCRSCTSVPRRDRRLPSGYGCKDEGELSGGTCRDGVGGVGFRDRVKVSSSGRGEVVTNHSPGAGSGGGRGGKKEEPVWQLYLAARDAFSVGRGHRYPW